METFNFYDCIEEAKGEKQNGKLHLMLGNGFSISLFPNIFNYSKLKEAAQEKGLQSIFDSFKTNDYEFVMRKILDAKLVLDALNKHNEEFEKYLDEIYKKLSETLIETIARDHPENPLSISEEQYQSCRDFINI